MPLLLKMHFRPRIRLRHFARWNTNPFKLEALDGFDPHTLPLCLPPSPSPPHPPNSNLRGGSIMLQLHLSPRHSPCRPAPTGVFPHLDTWECVRMAWRAAGVLIPTSPPLPAHLPAIPRWEVWDCAMSRGSFSSTLSYLMVFEDASGFLPPLLPTFLHAGAIFNRYIPCRPFFRAPASRRRTHCVRNPLQSIPQWYFVGGFPQMQLFLFFFSSSKSNGGEVGTKLHRSGLIPDRQKNTNKINLCQLPPGAGMKEHNGTTPKQERGREQERQQNKQTKKK